MKKAKQGAAILYLLLAMCIVPLYFENNYINLLQAKAHAAITVSACILLLVTGLFFTELFKKTKSLDNNRKNMDVADILLLLYALIAILSSALSSKFLSSLFGMENWCVGSFLISVSILIAVYFSHNFEYKHNLMIPVLIINALIFALAILNSVQIDPLGMQSNIVDWQKHLYLSTIGNANWFVGYLCLVMPLFVLLYVSSKSAKADIFYLIAIVPGLFAVTCCGSDGVFVGFGLCAFFAVPYVMTDESKIRKMMLVISAYGASLLIFRYLPCFEYKVSKTEGIHAVLLNPIVSVAILILGIAGYILLKNRFDILDKKTKNVITVSVISIMLVAVIYVFIVNILRFNDDWGTQRGLIWRHAFELFKEFSIKDKILGVGPEMIGPMMSKLTATFNMQVLAVHSEIIQIIISVGVLGFAGFIGFIGTIIFQFFRKKVWKKDYAVFFVPLAAYFGQAFVNSAMATNIVILAAVYICYRSFYLKDGDNMMKSTATQKFKG